MRFDVPHKRGGVVVGCCDQVDELMTTSEHSPNHSDLAKRGFAGSAWHCHGETLTVEHDSLDKFEHLQVVSRPFQSKQVREIGLGEKTQLTLPSDAAVQILRSRQRCNVLARLDRSL